MNKQLVVAMVSIAMIASSCVSTPKSEYRGLASEEKEASAAVVEIAKQGIIKPVSGVFGTADLINPSWKVHKLEESDMKNFASAYDVKLSDAQLMTDNDMAFEQKLRVIESAKRELRMVYFIYADDDSSSKLNSALLAKAKQGVKVKLLVDFITNYKNLDLFIALNKLSNKNISVYFYNFPSSQIFEDANYITLPCPRGEKPESDTCYNDKMQKMSAFRDKDGNVVPTAYGKLLLTGIYGKSLTAIKLALGLGADIRPEDYKNRKATSEEDGQAMLDLAKIVKEAFFDGSIIAKIKLSIAMSMYGEKINPLINELTGRLPLRNIHNSDSKDKEKAAHGALWDHMSDYTHHKLVLADNEQFVLGGRNVEDSYHMKHRVGSAGKYIFMDTDMWGLAKDENGAKGIADAFDRLQKSSMVAPLETVKFYLSYDFVANISGSQEKPGATEMAIGTCMQQKVPDVGACALEKLSDMPNFIGEEARVRDVVTNMTNAYQNYQDNYKPTPTAQFNRITKDSEKDFDKDVRFHYLENSNTNKEGVRVKGSSVGYEAQNNKNIQAVWYRALENVCKVSKETKTEKRVIFNSAYLLMPSGLVHTLARMMNNDFGDCSRVRVTFITNSAFTTDLAPINVLARYQLGALFDHYRQLLKVKSDFEQPGTLASAGEGSTSPGRVMQFTYKHFWPTLEYYEYTPTDATTIVAMAEKGEKPQSLHTKTTLIGDDLIVGSANADVRSYMMDTNNAMMIRNAKKMNQDYINFVDGLISSGRIKNRLADFQNRSFEQLKIENETFLQASARRWKQEGRLDSNFAKTILTYVDKAGQEIYNTTMGLLTYRNVLGSDSMTEGSAGRAQEYNKELNDRANRMDNMFKVF